MFARALLALEDEEERERRRVQLHAKQFIRDISNPFMMGDEQFRKHYRMTPAVAINLIEMLRPHLPPEHSLGVQVHLQVLSTLRFLAEGSYQKGVANDVYHPMSQSTFSKYLHAVIPAINNLREAYIVFPRNRQERRVISERFQESIGFPGVIGAIDCTLPKIHTPADHEEAYVNHHQDHSLNVQVVCDMDYNITNIRVCNGSSNDRFVWQHSQMREIMYDLRDNPDPEEIEENYYLIGDGGYTPSTVLLTPYQEAQPNTPEFRFSDRLRRTRCRVEQTFGIWKEIFRCLNNDRCLHYTPRFAAEITIACAVLYNYLRHEGMPMPVPPAVQRAHPVIENVHVDNEYVRGLQVRQDIVNRYFA